MITLKGIAFFNELPYGKGVDNGLRSIVVDRVDYEKEKVIKYLKGAITIVVFSTIPVDVLREDRPPIPGHNAGIKSDGEWAWPSDLSYYIENYNIKLPEEFLKHIESNRWKMNMSDKEIEDFLESIGPENLIIE